VAASSASAAKAFVAIAVPKNLLRLRGCHRLAERRVTQRLHPPFGPFGLKKARRRAHHVADHQAIYTTFKSRKSS